MPLISPSFYSSRPIRYPVVFYYFGQLLQTLGFLLIAPVIVALWTHEYEQALIYSFTALLASSIGVGLRILRPGALMQVNEALVAVVLIYLVASMTLTVPFSAAGIPLMDAWFEAVSAITTTGLTTVGSLADKPTTFLFARSWMQWIGGLGIVVFTLVVLIGPGVAAKQLTDPALEATDMPGSSRAHVLRVLGVYLVLTTLGFLFLLIFLDGFSALTHTLSAISTGGFSLYDKSLAEAGNWSVRIAVLSIAVLGAVPLPLYFRFYKKQQWRSLLLDAEVRALFFLVVFFAILLSLLLHFQQGFDWEGAVGHGGLVMISAQTGTGFSTLSLTDLTPAALLLVIAAMFIGGGVASTSGGIKLFRFLILLNLIQWLVVRNSVSSHTVIEPRIAGKTLTSAEIQHALLIVLLFLLVPLLSWFPFLLLGHDPLAALFEVVSATATVGLSSGICGPDLATSLKGVLIIDMLLGRLEIVALLVVLWPGTWIRKRSGV